MKKVREKLKKVGVLFIAGLLCFNSFAAIVSDNDGSAFITKAEFDSLKNDFQAQIDSYNTSIDNKIDGAIAAYLAGIRVSKTETQNIFLYKQKVVSARNNVEINWEEGNMQFGGNLTVARNPGGTGQNYLTGSLFVQWPGVTATNFKEILVEGAFNNSYGIFKSFSYTKQKLTVTGVNQADSTGFGTDWSVAGGRVRLSPLSSWANVTDYGSDANKGTSLSSYSGSEYPDGIIRMNGQMHPSYNTGFYAFIPWSGSVWQREVGNTIYDCVICTPTTNTAGGFSRNDVVNSFYNDSSSINGYSGRRHTSVTDGTGNIVNGEGSTTWTMKQTNTTRVNNAVTAGPLAINSTRGTGATITKMYYGFTNIPKGWHHLCTELYDEYIDDLKVADPGTLPTVTITPREGSTSAAKEHLLLTAGYPLVYAKKGQKLTYQLEFSESKPIDVWMKVGAFQTKYNGSNIGVNNDNQGNWISGNLGPGVTGTYVKNGTKDPDTAKRSNFKNCFTIDATKGLSDITFEMPRTGYVFMKWGYNNGTNDGTTGGGILIPAKTIKVTTDD